MKASNVNSDTKHPKKGKTKMKMRTFGGVVRPMGSVLEMLEIITSRLDASGYPEMDHSSDRRAHYMGVESMEQLFGAFRIFTFTDSRGLYRLAGYDDDFYSPWHLFKAAGPFFADGSWIAWTDNRSEGLNVAHMVNGSAELSTVLGNVGSPANYYENLPALIKFFPPVREVPYQVSDAPLPSWYTEGYEGRSRELHRILF